jgi:adenylylsulfate kinase
MKILIMGLPGSGKTWLAERLQKHLNCAWYNADKVREMANDWEFSEAARLRQAYRMKNIADFENENNRDVICDFVCPLDITREIFEADVMIWMNTIDEGRFGDTNKMFQKPTDATYVIDEFLSDTDIGHFANQLTGVHQ